MGSQAVDLVIVDIVFCPAFSCLFPETLELFKEHITFILLLHKSYFAMLQWSHIGSQSTVILKYSHSGHMQPPVISWHLPLDMFMTNMKDFFI
jgi:hypothetical protein